MAFRSIQYAGNMVGSDNMLQYDITDTDFSCRQEVKNYMSYYIHSINPWRAVAIIYAYKEKQLPVAQNLALYYAISKLAKEALEEDQKWMDRYFPELNYSARYHQCVLRQLTMLRYRGR